MALPHANCFQLPKVNPKCLSRVTPVYSCLKTSAPALHLQSKVDPLLDSVKWDDKGLAVAIAQNVDTGAVLMQRFINRDALLKTISSRKATFYSRSRSTLWTKGETSMNFINVFDIFLDCDRDSIKYLGKPDGPTCHTGAETCYYTSVDEEINNPLVAGDKLALTTLYSLESTISKRKEDLSEEPDSKPSWTKRCCLMRSYCAQRSGKKRMNCAGHWRKTRTRVGLPLKWQMFSTMPWYYWLGKAFKVEDVLQVLRLRFAQSGIDEKKSRKA